MSEERIIYGFCGANCREPVYSREEVLSILQQAIEAGSLQGIDVTKSPVVALIRESRANNNVSFWMGTEAQFNEISPAVDAAIVMARIDANGKVYLCTDDTTLADLKSNIVCAAETAAESVISHGMKFIGENPISTESSDIPATWTAKGPGYAFISADGQLTDQPYTYGILLNLPYNGDVMQILSKQPDGPLYVRTGNNNIGWNGTWFQIYDANHKQQTHSAKTATLTVAGWADNAQTVSVAGVTANNTVFVAPAPASQDAYAAAGIKCTAQAAGTLTFTCTEAPTEAITVNVVIMEV